jgi:hypothetical protein
MKRVAAVYGIAEKVALLLPGDTGYITSRNVSENESVTPVLKSRSDLICYIETSIAGR